MANLLFAPCARQDADDRTGWEERGKRHPPAASHDPTRSDHRSEGRRDPGRSEWIPAGSGRREWHEACRQQAPSAAADPILVTLLAGLVAEMAVPWAIIWLSDALVFDVPAWSLWLIFGVPAALAFLAVLIEWTVQAWLR